MGLRVSMDLTHVDWPATDYMGLCVSMDLTQVAISIAITVLCVAYAPYVHGSQLRPMALYSSTVTSTPNVIPAKNVVRLNCLILRVPCVILHPHSSTPSLSLSPKPNSPKPLLTPLSATLPQKCVYPDPIPEFAIAETQKFRAELLKKLSGDRDTYGDELDIVVNVCAEILSEFLHKDYGGPGTLLVEPFTDMLVALKEKILPGAPLAARASLLWAQNNVDRDWEVWTSDMPK
ncbi:unnamed protein product [Ilex paraguariensis]|uniref:Uncharacterized protein n=1 Tax=Ilex paraguariensis TaxID=185542 RepID=A0ABC8UN35_9AQUA